MDNEEKVFYAIAEKLSGKNKDVILGKMMSSPGIKYKNKIFAFYYHNQMVFKLG